MKKITKEEINQLPIARFEGDIMVVNTPELLQSALDQLEQEKILGFDTETRPAFKKGVSYNPSLIQLCGEKQAFLIQIKQSGFSDRLLALLSNKDIIKAGVAIKFDLKKLKEIRNFEPKGFIEIANLAKNIGYENLGLRSLSAAIFGFRITKSVSTSNWAADKLNNKQIVYAATDAWVGRILYCKLIDFL